jgi:hypothetical protein
MASKGQVTLRGRFSKGSVVTLTKVAGEHVLRPAGGEQVETKTVEEKDGTSFVQFTSGVEVGARYFVHGINDGFPLEVRVTGREADADSEVLAQAPVQPDRVKLTDGSFLADKPTKESPPKLAVTFPGQRQVADGIVQRSDTPRGSAHPVDVGREEPVRRQESVKDGTVQMSDTRPREVDGVKVGGGGEATEIVLGAQRQEDTPDSVIQRSSTPTGVSQPLPAGDMVEAQEVRDSSATRESRGDNTRGAAEPLEAKGVKSGPPTGSKQEASEERQAEALRRRVEAPREVPTDPLLLEGENVGRDAQGQPVYEDVAAAAGIEPASDEPDPARVKAGKKAAATRKRNEEAGQAPDSAREGETSRTQTGAASTTNTTAKE